MMMLIMSWLVDDSREIDTMIVPVMTASTTAYSTIHTDYRQKPARA